jgi:hypothetical protein
MRLGDNVGTFVLALIYIAILFVLVRPASNGPAFITAITGGMVNLVSMATGGGSLSGGSSTGTSTAAPAPIVPVSSSGTATGTPQAV